jgi:hypothetical protein
MNSMSSSPKKFNPSSIKQHNSRFETFREDKVKLILLIISILLIGLVVFLLDKQEKINIPLVGPAISSTKWEDLEPRISKLIYLEDIDEEPTIAVVKDEEKLRGIDPDLYRNTKNKDIIIIFSDRIIIYRSEDNKIIQASRLNRNTTESVEQ